VNAFEEACARATAWYVPTILFAGRVVREKGIFDTIRAVERVSLVWRCSLVVAGNGPDLEEAMRLAGSLGVAATFLGHVTDMTPVYRDADVLVLPSYSEGFPTTIAEAMHAGLPLVTTGIRGMRDHLVEGVNALLVTPGSVDEIAAALTRIVGSPAFGKEMGRANIVKVREFAPDRVVGAYLAALEEVSEISAS
jgi:glycosyltransferase involved in cell wall biosynthesis